MNKHLGQRFKPVFVREGEVYYSEKYDRVIAVASLNYSTDINSMPFIFGIDIFTEGRNEFLTSLDSYEYIGEL